MDHEKEQPVSGGRLSAIFVGTALLIVLYLTSLYSYLLFHSLAEIFSTVVAFGIFVIAWNSRRFIDNHYLLLLGISFLFVGAIDMLHTLAYKGMGVFRGYDANLPTQLWIAFRSVLCLSYLAAFFFLRRKLNTAKVFAIYFVSSTLLVASIFTGVFPDCYVEGSGLTAFKKAAEYVISMIFLVSLAFLFRNRQSFERDVFRLLALSLLASVASELAFTQYVSVYGLSNMMGHYFEILSFFLVYRAIIVTGLVRPYDLIFRDLRLREQALAESEKRVRLLNEELRRHNLELEAANRELEAFSYSVSHDLRAPLRSIDGFSQALLEDYSERIDERGKDFLGRIRTASHRMAQLIDDLLRLSRVTRSEMQLEPVDMSALARTVADELSRSRPERAAEFAIAENLTVNGDARLLRLVLENLLSNSWKFTCNTPKARIELGLAECDGKKAYYVRDNGAGFDMAYAGKLFEPFQRLHTATDFPGTGIGLAIVQRIVSRHGGRVWAEGETGKGATFYFTLQETNTVSLQIDSF